MYFVCSFNIFHFYTIGFSLLYLAQIYGKSFIRIHKLRRLIYNTVKYGAFYENYEQLKAVLTIFAKTFHHVLITYIREERSAVPLTRFNAMFHLYSAQKGNTGLKWVKEPLINRFNVLRDIYCVWILESRWICRLRFIAYFCFFIILCLGTSFKRLVIVHLTIII